MTRQVWLDFHPGKLPSGRHTGRVTLQCGTHGKRTVPIQLTVWPLRFPDKTTLRLGGWSYTDADRDRGMTLENRDALIAHLRGHLVNAPWARSSAVPAGRYDEAGNLIEPPDTARFDAWVKRWPDAQCYMVFFAAGHYSGILRPAFGGSKLGTGLFDKKVGKWARFWADHMRKLGLKPSQLGLLIFDEPNEKEHYDALAAWAYAIHAAEPDIVVWLDPTPKTKSNDYFEMMAQMDVLVPNRWHWYQRLDWYPELFEQQRRGGRELGFYSCSGPARSFDPYAYYLLQAWHSFKIGGRWSQFWSFNDTGGTDPWNDYEASAKGSFCPMYLQETFVVADKRMEAIRESAEDFEYLVMLRNRAGQLDAAGANGAALRNAKRVLQTACDRVLAGMTGPQFRWDVPRDRGVADAVRLDILSALKAIEGGG